MTTGMMPPLFLLIALLMLAGCWPLAQALKHRDQSPLAAFLLFASVLGLVAAAVYFALTWLVTLLVGTPGLAIGVICLIAAVLAGAAAGWQVVRRPPRRRMPD